MSSSPRSDDAALLSGGPEEFGRFYLRHEAHVLRFFIRRVRGLDTAADLCAETFARALEHRRSFDPRRGEGRAWLFGIARHVLAESLAKGRVLDETRVRLEFEPLVIDDDSLERLSTLADDVAMQALRELPGEQREAVEARVLEDRAYGELAVTLECSESVVRQRVSRGLRSIRDRLDGGAP
ncbi:MAG TPA: RNA polymerase sigma factor [Solirubrobacteraceae bacterium]|jgi:RNA polymerase sigma-70 factor (ECF subfamily)|nr:RNA polymerase sigma factor [Solirubrobacteraceae bacterium]